MKTYEEMADEVFRIGEERINEKKKKKKQSVLCLSFIALAAVAAVSVIGLSRTESIKPDIAEETQSASGQTQEQEPTSAQTETYEETAKFQGGEVFTQKNARDEFTDGIDGEYSFGSFFRPWFPGADTVTFSKEKITDAEAAEYFKENLSSIVSSLSHSGVETQNITVSEKGYSHAYFDGAEGKALEIRANFRDYLLYSSGKLTAIITLTKTDEKITATPSFGAPWFEKYSKYLESHRGEKLVYLYASSYELIISPDGKVFNPIGLDVSVYAQIPYEKLLYDEIIYIP